MMTPKERRLLQVMTNLCEIQMELERAQAAHPAPFYSMHEGKAVIEEEFDELWDEIKIKHPDRTKVRKECIQVAAMALRFLCDVVPLDIQELPDAAEEAFNMTQGVGVGRLTSDMKQEPRNGRCIRCGKHHHDGLSC